MSPFFKRKKEEKHDDGEEAKQGRIREILASERVLKQEEYEGGRISLTENFLLWEKKEKSNTVIIPREEIRKVKQATKGRKGMGMEVTCGDGRKHFFPFMTRLWVNPAHRAEYDAKYLCEVRSWIVTLETGIPSTVEESMTIEELLSKLEASCKAKDEKLEAKARNRLKEIGQPVFEKISAIPARRAITLLGLMEDERGIDFLIRALKTETNEFDRQDAAASLGLIEKANKTGKTIEPLIEALKTDESPRVRASAATVLRFIETKDPRIIDALIEALNDSGWWREKEVGVVFGLKTGGNLEVSMNSRYTLLG